jgi:serine/threonine protein kinase
MSQSNEIFITESDFRNRYQYSENDLLGEGGFAQVYKALDKQFQEYVALKFYNKGEQGKYDVLHEMKDSRKFSHPNIIRIHDAFVVRFDHTGGHSFVQVGILEFANGGNLRDFIKTKPTEEKFVEVLSGILSGLYYLHHEKKMIHRDLSPENILMYIEDDNWIPKIADFGISKRIDFISDVRDKTKSTQLLGKIDYMAPEQFYPERFGIDGKINTNVDLWAFGVILYELFRRERPFDKDSQDNPLKIIQTIVSSQIPKLGEIPEPYCTIIKRCLEKKAINRVQGAGELITILNKASIKKPLQPQTRQQKRSRLLSTIDRRYLFMGSLTLLILIFSGYFILGPNKRKSPDIQTTDLSKISLIEIDNLIKQKSYDAALSLINQLPEDLKQRRDLVEMRLGCIHQLKLDSLLLLAERLFKQKQFSTSLMNYRKIINEFDSSNTLAKSRIDTIQSLLRKLNAPKPFVRGIYKKNELAIRISPESEVIEIESIEITASNTIISLRLAAGESRYFSSPGKNGAFYIEYNTGRKRLNLKGINGVRTGTFIVEDKDTVFQLYFDKLPDGIVEFNLINGDSQFHKEYKYADFFGVRLK